MALTGKADKQRKLLTYIISFILLAGTVVRIIIYLQNRNLIIDEANIARNLYERSFAGLALPLKYEQYAPPIFLWIEKLNTVLFGFSEYALRLWPLIAGLAALYVFYSVIKELGMRVVAWLPLLLFAGSHICIRYASEAKQYMPDVFVVLTLILLALRLDIKKYRAVKFAAIWFVVGSVAIWSSMPSVFVLAGIGFYYAWNCLKEKNYSGMWPLAVTGVLWLAQFAFYYFAILAPQANSDYLQQFHQYFFFNIYPDKPGELQHDIDMYRLLAGQFSGNWPFALLVNTLFLLTGIIVLVRKNFSRALLLLTPLALMLVAAALRQFSLIPRVVLFSLPLMMILAGYGFYSLWQATAKPVLRIVICVIALYPVASNISYSLYAPYKYEQLTDGLRWLQKKGITGNYLYLYWSSGPAFTYYTEIHPGKGQWADLVEDHMLLPWAQSYTRLSWEMKHMWRNTKPVGFIFTNGTDREVYYRVQDMRNFMTQKACYDNYAVKAFIFRKN